MKSLECSVIVDEKREVLIQLPGDIPLGRHRLLVTVDVPKLKSCQNPLEGFPTIRLGYWPEGLSLSREELYGDDGR